MRFSVAIKNKATIISSILVFLNASWNK